MRITKFFGVIAVAILLRSGGVGMFSQTVTHAAATTADVAVGP